MKQFPFPDRVASRDELKQDVLYHRIPEEERERICDKAWEVGAAAAQASLVEHPGSTVYEIADAEGLQLVREKIDKVSAGLRFFSEYFPKKKCIYIYELSVRLFAKKNELAYEEAEELILAHEYFHFLEENRIGETSKQYKIPKITIGSWKTGESGIHALSEIGAHGFARTYWDAVHGSVSGAGGQGTVRNATMNVRMAQGKQEAEKMLNFMFGKRKK